MKSRGLTAGLLLVATGLLCACGCGANIETAARTAVLWGVSSLFATGAGITFLRLGEGAEAARQLTREAAQLRQKAVEEYGRAAAQFAEATRMSAEAAKQNAEATTRLGHAGEEYREAIAANARAQQFLAAAREERARRN